MKKKNKSFVHPDDQPVRLRYWWKRMDLKTKVECVVTLPFILAFCFGHDMIDRVRYSKQYKAMKEAMKK